MRKCKGKKMEGVSGLGVCYLGRKSRNTAADEAELRRAILAAWRHESRGKKRGMREEAVGFIGEGSGGEGNALIVGSQGGGLIWEETAGSSKVEDDDVIILFFLFLLFLFSFISFDLGLQINSNKFVKICKIPNIENRHLGTIFVKNKITQNTLLF